MCLWRCGRVDVDEISVVIFTGWELEFSIDEELSVDLLQLYLGVRRRPFEPSIA